MGNGSDTSDLVSNGNGSGGTIGRGSAFAAPRFGSFVAVALIINLIDWPIGIMCGLALKWFVYSRELGLFLGGFYVIGVILPMLVLFANRLPEILPAAADFVRACKGLPREASDKQIDARLHELLGAGGMMLVPKVVTP